MPHFPKPFFRAARDAWYIQIAGRQYRLGGAAECDAEEAADRAAELRRRLKSVPPPNPSGPSETVAGVLEDFLAWAKSNREPRTYEFYRDRCRSFVRFATPSYSVRDLTAADLRPFHVQEWVDAHPSWSPGTRRGCMVTVQRAFNWASQMGKIGPSPLARLKKPRAGRRDRVLTPDEYEYALAKVTHPGFRDLLEFAWWTGARPQEVVAAEARHVDLANGWVRFPPEEAKGRRHHRVIYLVGRALEVVGRIVKERPEGHLFLNAKGRPWTPWAVNCAFNRLQKALGREKMRAAGVRVRATSRPWRRRSRRRSASGGRS